MSQPMATYEIVVTEPRWLEHLVVGGEFVSHAYSEDGPFLT